MGKKAAKPNKKRGSDAAAAAAEEHKQKKAKPEKKQESSEEHESGSEDVSDEGEKGRFALWQEQLDARAAELDAFVALLGNIDKDGDDDKDDDEDEGEDEEKEPTPEELEAMTRLFLPIKTKEYLEQVSDALGEIGCSEPEDEDEDEDEEELDEEEAAKKKAFMQMFKLRMLTTRHSYPMHAIIKESLKGVDKAIKKKDWKDAFCRWTATLMAATNEEHWFMDTDAPAEVNAIYKQLKKQWGQIKQHSEQELGNPVCEGGKSPSVKGALDVLLSKLAESLEEMEYSIE